MPLRLNVGLTQKIGQPNYSSLGASCHVEVELDSHLLKEDFNAFQQHVKNAFNACRQAVKEELDRSGSDPSEDIGDGMPHSKRGVSTSANTTSATGARKATVSQIGAIQAITRRTNVDLSTLLYQRYRFTDPLQLSLRQASSLIAELKNSTKVNLAA